jgi:glycosyltransferase involved in cell wall biosynthesis
VNLSEKQMRVAIVAPSLAILGGQSVQADQLLQCWRTDPAVDAWLVPHNPVPPYPFRWMTRIKYLRTVATEATYLRRLFTELRHADVVHVFSASYWSFLLAPLPALLVARLLNRPVILNYHSGEAPDHLQRSRIARWAIGLADRIAVPSAFLSSVFRRFGFEAIVVPNLIDVARFRYRVRDPLAPKLLSTRNFEPLYNVACTLRAFRTVQDRYPDASLTLVGAGSDEHRLKALAASLNLRNVAFTGRVDPQRINECYAAHDIYIQSPDIDNMPLSVLEAFASGLPVVSTDAGGVPSLLRAGIDGLLAPVDDADALAARVMELLADPGRARALAQSAYGSLRPCTWSEVRARWVDLYRAVRPRTAAGAAAVRA